MLWFTLLIALLILAAILDALRASTDPRNNRRHAPSPAADAGAGDQWARAQRCRSRDGRGIGVPQRRPRPARPYDWKRDYQWHVEWKQMGGVRGW